MKQFLLTIAGVFVGLMLFVIVVPIALIAIAVGASRPAPLPAKSVLTLDLRERPHRPGAAGRVADLHRHGLSVMGVEETLRRAAADGQVAGVFVRLPEAGIAPAAADELRLAFQAFRASGKPILAFSQGIYPEGVATATYELGAASGDLWMQPSASFQATGLAQEDLFLKRFFDKYGVVADYQQRYQYKNAVNGYLYDDYTPAHREAELSWMGSVYATTLAAGGAGPQALARRAEDHDRGRPLFGRRGQGQGPGRQRRRGAGGRERHPQGRRERRQAGRLLATTPSAPGPPQSASMASGPTIALIQAEGDIVTGTAGHGSPLGGGSQHLRRRPRQGLLQGDRRQGRQSHRLPPHLARRLRHRLRGDPLGGAGGARRPASRWWSAWATTAPRAATGSRRRPTRSSPSPRP